MTPQNKNGLPVCCLAVVSFSWSMGASALDCREFEHSEFTEADMRESMEVLKLTIEQLIEGVEDVYFGAAQKIQRSSVGEATKRLLLEQEYEAKEQKARLLRCMQSNEIAKSYGY